jgi:polysaccharide deacetylase family protein (PEP-CTERM system associated)
MPTLCTNVLSIDLEEWYQLSHRHFTGQAIPPRDSIFRQVDYLLDLFQRHGVRATFFALGLLIESHPELLRRISEAGHEIGSHGYAHLQIFRLTRQQFQEDTRRARQVVEDALGAPVRGYRAAYFSIGRSSLWALEVLAENGFEYDSSIFPIHHRRYGIPDFDRRTLRYHLPNGLTITEVPLATVPLAGSNVPIAGGGYVRLLPYPVLRRAVRRLNASGTPLVTYFHPYEFDEERLDILRVYRPAGAAAALRAHFVNFEQNLRRASMRAKLERLLRDFRFTSFAEYLREADLNESRALLPTESGQVRRPVFG